MGCFNRSISKHPENLSDCPDAARRRFVRVGQSRARHFAAEPHVIQLALESTQAGLDIAQALAIGELREGHRQ
jgi:hypothetical protein